MKAYLIGLLVGVSLGVVFAQPRSVTSGVDLGNRLGYAWSVFPGQPYDPENVRTTPIAHNAYIPLVRCINVDAK